MKGVGTIVWQMIMFLLAAMITIVAFLAAVAPENRGVLFYVWLAVLCGGEFIIFTWSVNYQISKHGRGLTGATLQTIHLLMIWWFLIAVPLAIVGGLATGLMEWLTGGHASQWHDVVAELFAVMTLLFLLGAAMIYAKDLELQGEDRATQPDRIELQVWVAHVEEVVDNLRRFASEDDDHAASVDRLIKKLDAIRSSLQHAPPGKFGVHEEDGGRSVTHYNARIIGMIEELQAEVTKVCAGEEQTSDRLREIDQLLDRCESTLRQRQQFLLVGGAH
jgi:cob(I)alamin adenosyltransferase